MRGILQNAAFFTAAPGHGVHRHVGRQTGMVKPPKGHR